MTVLHRRRFAVLALAGLIGSVAACTEDLETTAGCPLLCAQEVPVRDSIFPAPFSLDTSIAGYPLSGSEGVMLLAGRGDTVDTRVVLRFDSLITTYNRTPTAAIELIREVDSAYVLLRFDPLGSLRRGTLTLQVYDIDGPLADTSAAAVLARFTPDRLFGSITLPGERVIDSLAVPLDPARLVAKIRDSSRVRLGVRVVGSPTAQLRMYARESGRPAELRYRPTPGDSNVRTIRVGLANAGPEADALSRQQRTDYMLVVRGTSPPPPGELLIGGIPASRALLRFGLPTNIVDSTNVIRASLELTRRAVAGFAEDDTVTVLVELSTATDVLTDVARSLLFTQSIVPLRGTITSLLFATDSVRVAPATAGTIVLDLAGVLQLWRSSGNANLPRAIVLRVRGEGSTAVPVRVYSSEAAPALRPRLRITYVPGRVVGLP